MKRRYAMIIAAALLAAGGWMATWIARHAFTRPYTQNSLRVQWQRDGSLERVDQWAQSYLKVHRWPHSLRTRDLPSVTGPARISSANPIRDKNGNIVAVAFELGGADNHHGVVIGERVAPPFGDRFRAQWGDHTWWYDEVPRMDERSSVNVP
jgi:hypothetical protein